MITFKEFLLEQGAVATKRKNLQHLQAMKPADFVELVQALHKKFPSGKLTNVPINVKVDGIAFRFGHDVEGRPFIETSYSGPVYKPGEFTAFAQQRGDPGMIERARKTDELFRDLLRSEAMQVVPTDRKVVCEMLYNPLGEITASGAVKFGSVGYDRSKLGSVMTIAPRAVLVSSTGEEAPDADKIIKSLLEVSSPAIKVISPRLQHTPIDISATIDAVRTLTPKAVEILRSRKAADQEAKQAIAQTIQAMKERLADIILQHKGYRGLDVLGNEIEGLVLMFGDDEVKVTTPQMKQAIATRRAAQGK